MRELSTNPSPRGFSLLEMLVCLAVAVILGVIALPGFASAWRRAHRAEAVDALARLQLDQQRFYLEQGRFAASLEELQALTGAGTLPEHYSISVSSASADEFRAEAAAVGAQRTDRAECLLLGLNQRGERSPAGDSGCWR